MLVYICHLFEQSQQVLPAVALCHLLVWRQSCEVSAALRLQVAAFILTTLDVVEDDGERAGQQTRVMIRT